MNIDKITNDTQEKTRKVIQFYTEDYKKNGLIYCGKCNTSKQCKIVICGGTKLIPCLCKCANESYQEQRQIEKENERMLYIESLRMNGIKDKTIQKFSFDNAEKTSLIKRCMKYVDNWNVIKKDNIGLLFWGGVGVGKTFAAGCIANALIDKGISVIVTSFPRILNSGWNKSEIIDSIKLYDLMVIDDFGTERNSQYAIETVYLIIDERIKTGKPLIITTNLTMNELNSPINMDYCRIYDRILSHCKPVYFYGGSKRKKLNEQSDHLVNKIFD